MTAENPLARRHETCLSCGSPLELVLSFGPTPVADLVLTEDQLTEDDLVFPMDLAFCPDCTLLQLMTIVSPEILYRGEYPYYTSQIPALVKHYSESAERVIEEQGLNENSRVVEIASNDGYMLRVFRDHGIEVCGIDPATGPAEIANADSIHTLCEFFTLDVVRKYVAEHGHADVVTSNNLMNLLSDLDDFGRAVDYLLKKDGVCVFEVPYSVTLVDECSFDMIFHQNICYFSMLALDAFFRRHGLYINEAKRVPTFGGSLRLVIGRNEQADTSVTELLAEERAKGFGELDYYRRFAEKTESIRKELRACIEALIAEGKRIVAYGAAGGMATTLLSYLDLAQGQLEYAVDGNEHKHGLYTPGLRLKIHPPSKLLEDRPDYALLLAWNYRKEVLEQNDAYRQGGGKFIIPLPKPEIV